MSQYKPERNDLRSQMAKLSEELGEAQAALGKTMRWGFSSFNPELSVDERQTNYHWLCQEMIDVNEA